LGKFICIISIFFLSFFSPNESETFEFKKISLKGQPSFSYTSAIYDPDEMRIVLLGGVGRAGSLGKNLFYILNLKQIKKGWKSISLKGKFPAGLRDHAAAYNGVDHQFFLFGGTTSGGQFGKSYFIDLNPGDENITLKSYGAQRNFKKGKKKGDKLVPLSRFYHTITYDSVNNRMILIGGKNEEGDVNNEIWSLSLMSGHEGWTKIKTKGIKLPLLTGHTAVYDQFNSRVLIYGGLDDGNNRLNQEIFEVSTKKGYEVISIIESFPAPPGRYHHSAVLDKKKKKMVVFGGNDGFRTLNDLFVFDLANEEWQLIKPKSPPAPRQYHVSVYNSRNGKIYFFGGSGFDLEMHQDFYVFSP